MYAVILAGGSGTRFWPLSRSNRPKQLLSIVGDTSMLQMTVDRLKKIKKIKDIYIITRADLKKTIQKEVTGIKPKNIFTEPEGKNTAPAIALMALHIEKKDPDAVMGIFPADHLIVGHQKFQKAVNHSIHLARKNHSLVTIGIQPTFPSTAYGYIQFSEKSEEDHIDGYHVVTFAEKPHQDLANRFVDSGDFLWNAGIFIWKVSTFFNGLQIHMPDLNEHMGLIRDRIKKKESFDDIWSLISPESIDYGLLEKAKDIFVIKAEFDWNDLGSWNAVYEYFSKSKTENVVRGLGAVQEGNNNLILSKNKFTAVIGVDNLVVINTDDATLVVPKDQVEKVKDLVAWLKKHNHEDLV